MATGENPQTKRTKIFHHKSYGSNFSEFFCYDAPNSSNKAAVTMIYVEWPEGMRGISLWAVVITWCWLDVTKYSAKFKI